MIATLKNPEVVAWVCLVVGVIVLFAGVYVGLNTSLKSAPETEKKKLEEAKEKVEVAKQTATNPEAGGAEAGQAADDAKSALEQIEGIVSSLPENLRFAGLLVLIGAVLIGVATIQFGGTSLF